jgi:hypothetical protein
VTRTVTRLVASTAVAAGLVLSAGATAHAEGTNVKDKASDVTYVPDASEDDYSVLGYQASIDSGVDLRGMRVKHGRKTVTVRLKFAQLSADTRIALEIRSDGRRKPDHQLYALSSRRAILYNTALDDTCTVPVTTRPGSRGTVSVTIKRSCLDEPDRLKVAATVFRGEVVQETGPVHLDAVSNTKVQGPSWTKWLRSG